jgi:hypothetical protein
MRGMVARCVVAMGAGLALMMAQGCRKQAAAPASVEPAVRSVARVQPDFPWRSLPVEDVDAGVTPRIDRGLRQWQQVQPAPVQRAPVQRVQVQPMQEQVRRVDVQNEAVAAAQRLEDARLLEQQQAASQRQQEELDQEIEQELKTQQDMEAEPRIQEIPEIPMEAAPIESTQPQ